MNDSQAPVTTLMALFAEGAIRYGEPNSFSGLTLFPLFTDCRARFEYLLLAQAVESGVAVIEEIGGGTVPGLRIHNQGEKPVLLLDGEHLVGVKQNRVLNATILVPEKTALDIPVSCVEAGRWGAPRSTAMPTSPALFFSTRAVNVQAVADSVRRHGTYEADQSAVWEGVDETLRAVGAASPTSAMHAAYEHRADDIEEYLKRLPRQQGQTGVVAAVGGRVVCADLFDRPETLDGLWDRLIPSYAVEALAKGDGGATGDGGAQSASGEAETFLSSARSATVTAHGAVGRGTDLRITGGGVVGAALEVEGAVLHLSLFRIKDRGQNGRSRAAGFAPMGERRRRKT
ncbi:MAG: hypothetical protein RDU83_10265 [bacterium]|nr:hypothetical protein [bacterium]